MIAVVFALEFEAAGFGTASRRRLRADVWTLGITGSRSAHVLERRIEEFRPSLIISAGLGGALQSDLPVGTVVVARNFTTPQVFELLTECPGLVAGDLVTVPSVLASAKAKAHLGEETGTIVADMETAHLFDIATRHGIPFLGVRSISDTSEEDLPVPGRTLINSTTGRPDSAALFQYLFKNPRASFGFARLVQNAQTARLELALALDRILPIVLRRGFDGG